MATIWYVQDMGIYPNIHSLPALFSLGWQWWGISFNINRRHLGLQCSFKKGYFNNRYFLIFMHSTISASKVIALLESHFIEVLFIDNCHILAIYCQINIAINIASNVPVWAPTDTEGYQCRQTDTTRDLQPPLCLLSFQVYSWSIPVAPWSSLMLMSLC